MKVFHPSSTEWLLYREGNEPREGEMAKFEIGLLPHAIFQKTSAEAAVARARLNALKDAKEKAGRADAPETPEEAKELADIVAEFGRINRETVRFGIRGHEGLAGPEGKPVPFKADTAKVADRDVPVVSEETLDLYQANLLTSPLSTLVAEVQGLPLSLRTK